MPIKRCKDLSCNTALQELAEGTWLCAKCGLIYKNDKVLKNGLEVELNEL